VRWLHDHLTSQRWHPLPPVVAVASQLLLLREVYLGNDLRRGWEVFNIRFHLFILKLYRGHFVTLIMPVLTLALTPLVASQVFLVPLVKLKVLVQPTGPLMRQPIQHPIILILHIPQTLLLMQIRHSAFLPSSRDHPIIDKALRCFFLTIIPSSFLLLDVHLGKDICCRDIHDLFFSIWLVVVDLLHTGVDLLDAYRLEKRLLLGVEVFLKQKLPFV
jgi:hypothetical protein